MTTHGASRSGRPPRTRRMLIDASLGFETAAVCDRTGLAAGQEICGPAIVEQPDTTTLVPGGWRRRADPAGNLLLTLDSQ